MSGAFGAQLGRYFGIATAPSLATEAADRPRFAVTRITCSIDQLGLKQTIPAEDSFVLLLHLADLGHLEIWRQGRPVSAEAYSRGSISIHDLSDAMAVYIGAALDCLCFYIPRALIDRMTDQAGAPRVERMQCPPDRPDPTMTQIGLALLPLLAAPQDMAPAFLDHIGIATGAHLAQAYGNFRPGSLPRPIGFWTH